MSFSYKSKMGKKYMIDPDKIGITFLKVFGIQTVLLVAALFLLLTL